jgi:hypothetical protein
VKLAIGTGSAGGVPSAPGARSSPPLGMRGGVTLGSGGLGRAGATGLTSTTSFFGSAADEATLAFGTSRGTCATGLPTAFGLALAFTFGFGIGFVMSFVAATFVAAFTLAALSGFRAFAPLPGRFAAPRDFFAGLREFVALPI